MLVLQRLVGESVDIGPEIRITVIALDSHSVRLGISAPPALLADAEETHERAQAKEEELRDKAHINWR